MKNWIIIANGNTISNRIEWISRKKKKKVGKGLENLISVEKSLVISIPPSCLTLSAIFMVGPLNFAVYGGIGKDNVIDIKLRDEKMEKDLIE